MDTAARATSSSASERSSSSNGSGFSERQKLATPRTTPRACSGTVMSEWMPYSTIAFVRSGSCARQPSALDRSGTTSARPVPSPRACGVDGRNAISLPRS